MFTINIKGKRNPKNIEMVKLEIIFYKSGYNRTSKVLYVSGFFKDWIQKKQAFIENSSENISKNKILQKERLKYLTIAERWESQGKRWTPIELSHYFDKEKETQDKYTSVAEMLDIMVEIFKKRERFKNGRIFTSENNAKGYRYLRLSLEKFTRSRYRKEFSKYKFRDINETFLLDYTLYVQKKSAKNNNQGGIHEKLKYLHSTFACAKRKGIYNIDMDIFKPVKGKLRPRRMLPKTVPFRVIQQIEQVDRSILDKKEVFYLDLFLFSFYAGGILILIFVF